MLTIARYGVKATMKLTLKLYASLSSYLPDDANENKVVLDVPTETSPIQLLNQYGVPTASVHLVLVNGVFVPPSQRNEHLHEGDELAVWPAVAGG